MSQFQADSLFNDKLGVIGLQPFKRPGDQKGYSLRLDEEEDLNDQSGIFKYTFDFSKEDSEYFFNHFKQGKKLWSEDPIVSKTWKIKISTLFSMDAVKKAIKFQRVQGFTIKEHYKFLKENGFSIRRKSPFFFNKKETGKIVVNWEHESDLFWESIVQRSVIKDGVKSETITLEDLKVHEMLRITGYRNFDER